MTDPTAHERFGLSTLEDISHLILQSRGLEQTLANIVKLVASRMKTEVCSIYLRDKDRLTLRANVGLSSTTIGRISFRFGEGLIGHTAKTCSVVNVNEPQLDDRYCHVVNSDEEKYHSFLGIPLFDRENLLGVVAVQTILPRTFSSIEISTLHTIAFQLSAVVANANLLDQLSTSHQSTTGNEGFPVAQEAGDANAPAIDAAIQASASIEKSRYGFGSFAAGPAFILGKRDRPFSLGELVCDDMDAELARLDEAITTARMGLVCLGKRVAVELSEDDAAIFHSHLMILQDPSFPKKIRDYIQRGASAIGGVKSVVAEYVTLFRQLDDPYLQGRGADVEDVGRRLISQLRGEPERHDPSLMHPCIVVADELSASEIAVLDFDNVLGVVIGYGDAHSHAVIIAKSLGIPTLIGLENLTEKVAEGTPLIIDAFTQTLHIRPTGQISEAYGRLAEEEKQECAALLEYASQPGKTLDGYEVTFRANIGLRSDVEVARRWGACGVGLYRTELPYMARDSFPDRQTQYGIYRYVVKNFSEDPVTIRTLDIGGDKALSYFDLPVEENPFLGWRSIRVSLEQRDEFQIQLEAILMAATHGRVRLMFPLITTIDEIVACKAMVGVAREKLVAQGWAVPDVPIGMMIETPASVTMADQFAKHVDFFSLGTNDLIQYLLAADRGNSRVSSLYDGLDPAVLRSIERVVQVGERAEISVGICGEMASDPVSLLILVGLGLREFSLPAPMIPKLKQLLCCYSKHQLDEWTCHVMAMDRALEIRQWMESKIASI